MADTVSKLDETIKARYDEVRARVLGEGWEVYEERAVESDQNGYPLKRGDMVLYRMNSVLAVFPGGYSQALAGAMGLDAAEDFINRCVIGNLAAMTETLLAAG